MLAIFTSFNFHIELKFSQYVVNGLYLKIVSDRLALIVGERSRNENAAKRSYRVVQFFPLTEVFFDCNLFVKRDLS